MRMDSTSILVASCILVACGGTVEKHDADGSTDPTPDIWVDTGTDPIPDPVADPGVDTPPDISVDTPPGSGVVGDPCVDETSCGGVPTAAFCLTNLYGYVNFPGGYCSGSCASEAECGPGTGCLVMGGYGACMKRCTSSAECRAAEGYTCGPIPYVTTETFCIPPF